MERWVRTGCKSCGKAPAGVEGWMTSVAYARRSLPVDGGWWGSCSSGAGASSGGSGGCSGALCGGSEGLEAAANVLRGGGERGKEMAEVVWSVRAGAGERESRRRGASSRWRRGWAEIRRMGEMERTRVSSNGGIRWTIFRNRLQVHPWIGTPHPKEPTRDCASIHSHLPPLSIPSQPHPPWSGEQCSSQCLPASCWVRVLSADVSYPQLTLVRRDNIYSLDCRSQRSLEISRHYRGH